MLALLVVLLFVQRKTDTSIFIVTEIKPGNMMALNSEYDTLSVSWTMQGSKDSVNWVSINPFSKMQYYKIRVVGEQQVYRFSEK